MGWIVAMGQAGVPDILGSDLTPAVILSLLFSTLLSALVVGFLLKIVAASILGHPVRYHTALIAMIAAVAAQVVVEIVLRRAGLVDIEAAAAALRRGRFIDQIMPLGPGLFVLAQGFTILILTIAIRAFVRGPELEVPSWLNAILIAVAMTALFVAFNYALIRLVGIPA
ncbi:MAG: hypothetical protein IT548_04235 [Alphaproteobacteria bacterium]|nr:hypothetical protein [Alphaproteobacteria bacterium]